MQDIYKVETHPLALSENMITGDKYRITFLTEGLIRLEYDEEGVFEDRPTQMVFFRDFPKTDYRVVRTEDGIELGIKYSGKRKPKCLSQHLALRRRDP